MIKYIIKTYNTENTIVKTDTIENKNELNIVKGSNKKHIEQYKENSKGECVFMNRYTDNGTL